MNMDIVIIRDGAGYRLLHGHLRLSNVLQSCGEAIVEVAGEGEVRILKTRVGYIVGRGDQRLPLLSN
ncbi:hypothetical protein D3870_18025 [Noviherbaspirillum cavernae]|uniref:Uncharacterized protein n=1 Tax=Noviherbaspirillum cavernae TaxID=2320862 RepID=A0A418X596_9BURK|nr:hypothetical protein [Noviherbaspirillum cavernae]RJG07642.1 hypothetical protein D3870_18025 [Noviherbaspirillum cavernae]